MNENLFIVSYHIIKWVTDQLSSMCKFPRLFIKKCFDMYIQILIHCICSEAQKSTVLMSKPNNC